MKFLVIQLCATLCLAFFGMGVALGVLALVNLGLEWSDASPDTVWYAYAALAFFWFVVLTAALSWWLGQRGFNLDIRITEIDHDDAKAAEPPTTTATRR